MDCDSEHLVLPVLCQVIHVFRTSTCIVLCTYIRLMAFGMTSGVNTLRFTYLTNGAGMSTLQLSLNRNYKSKYCLIKT